MTTRGGRGHRRREELGSGLRFGALALSPLLVLAGLIMVIVNVFGPIDAQGACASYRGITVEESGRIQVERQLMPVRMTCSFEDGTRVVATNTEATAWQAVLIGGGLALTVGVLATTPGRREVKESPADLRS